MAFGGFRPFQFLATWRSLPPYELASYPLMFASVPMLAYGSRPYDAALLEIIGLTVLSLYAGLFAALIVNDVMDADIDAVAHPGRPIPSGRISKKGFLLAAVGLSAVCFGVALIISIWCFALVVSATALATAHDKYLKRSVKLPGYSEFFGSVQWVVVGLFGYLAVWSRAHVANGPSDGWSLGGLAASWPALADMLVLAAFIYFADTWHDIPEGIHDAVGDRDAGVRTFAVSFGEKTAARLAFGIFLVSGLLGAALYRQTSLSVVFLISFIALFLYTSRHPFRFMRLTDVEEMRAGGLELGRKGFDYFLSCFNLVFIDLLVQHLASLA